MCAGLSASSFAVLRQGTLRRGNSCLDVGIARCDGARADFTLIALLPELGKMSRKQIAVLRLEGTTFPNMALTLGASSLSSVRQN